MILGFAEWVVSVKAAKGLPSTINWTYLTVLYRANSTLFHKLHIFVLQAIVFSGKVSEDNISRIKLKTFYAGIKRYTLPFEFVQNTSWRVDYRCADLFPQMEIKFPKNFPQVGQIWIGKLLPCIRCIHSLRVKLVAGHLWNTWVMLPNT